MRGQATQFAFVAGVARCGGGTPFVALPLARRQRVQRARSGFGIGVAVAHQAGGLLHGLRVDHGQAAPGEGLLVHRHGGAVELDGAHQ